MQPATVLRLNMKKSWMETKRREAGPLPAPGNPNGGNLK
jgi:hypothetical protein